MISEESINEAFRHAINLIVGEDEHALRAQQDDGLQLNKPYATVQLLTDDLNGIPFTVNENTSSSRVDAYLESDQIATYTLQFFKAGAFDRARNVAAGLVREDVKRIFKAKGLGLSFATNVTNISEPLEPGWEERATFDIDVNYIQRIDLTSETDEGANIIESYSIGATINDVNTDITCGEIQQ